jgi:MIP family channel proteins
VDKPLLRRTFAEAIGTYALVTAGCGAIMVNATTGSLTHVGVSLTFGLIIVVMIAAVGHISGAHFNPAVTIAFAVTRHFPWKDVLYYVVGQTGGAVLGALTLRVLLGDHANLGSTMPANSIGQAFGIEILLTAVLMFVIISVATDTRAVGAPAALAIGFTVMLDALWGGMISGASMNPARSFGPALVSGLWTDQWVYWIAPIVGAIIGALLYQFVRRPEAESATVLKADERKNIP